MDMTSLLLVGYGLGAIGVSIGIAIACYGCCTASARQPELEASMFKTFIIAAGMIEALGLIGFILVLILVFV